MSCSNEILDSDRTANVYFTSTSDIDTKNRIRSLNEFSKINLNAIRREGMHDDGVLNDCYIVIVLWNVIYISSTSNQYNNIVS